MPVNIWKDSLKDTPKENLNKRLWFSIFVFGLMGAARGIDEGLIGTSSTLKPFRSTFGLDNGSKVEQAQLLSNIASMVQMGSILGALIACVITDKIGRVWATRQLCLIWAFGIAIFMAASANGNVGMVLGGRFLAGIGIGQTTVVAPTYLAEISPKAIRGLSVCAFSGCVYIGIMLAYFASWGSSIHISDKTQAQWLVPTSMHLMFSLLIFSLSWFCIESPRWLVKIGKHEQAAINLGKIRGMSSTHDMVAAELSDVRAQLEREREATLGASWFGIVKELFLLPANRYRIMLSVMSQLLAQWSGANSITIYAPQYFAFMGVTGQNEKLLATCVFGLVKFVSAMLCAFVLVDFIGRKRSLITGITLQLIAMTYMALFLVIDTTVANKKIQQTVSQKAAAKGAIFMIYVSGFGWALGWNSIQYLLNSEIYPLRLRAIGGSIAMTVHFVNQYGNSKAVPLMFLEMTTGGTMWFFVAITAIGLGWAWFFLPETSKRSLEALDEMFNLPWYMIGRKGADLTEDHTALHTAEKEEALQMEYVEVVPNKRTERTEL